jgi:hypothetical protein
MEGPRIKKITLSDGGSEIISRFVEQFWQHTRADIAMMGERKVAQGIIEELESCR